MKVMIEWIGPYQNNKINVNPAIIDVKKRIVDIIVDINCLSVYNGCGRG